MRCDESHLNVVIQVFIRANMRPADAGKQGKKDTIRENLLLSFLPGRNGCTQVAPHAYGGSNKEQAPKGGYNCV